MSQSYHYRVLKSRSGFLGVQLSAAIINFTSSLISNEDFNSLTYSIAILSFFCYYLIKLWLDSQIFGSPNTDQKTSSKLGDNGFYDYVGICQVLSKGLNFCSENKKFEHKEFLLYLGLLSKHSKKCRDRKCFCKFFSFKKGNLAPENCNQFSKMMHEFNYKIRNEFFEEHIHHKTNLNWIYILYSQLILETRQTQYLTALSIISRVKISKTTILEKYMIDVLKNKIFELIDGEHVESKIDMIALQKYGSISEKLEGKITQVCKKSIEFWNYYNQTSPKITKLLQLSAKCSALDKETLKIWSSLQEECHYFAFSQWLPMALYFGLLRNSTSKSEEMYKQRSFLMEKYFTEYDRTHTITDKTVLDPNNILIRISMTKENLGIVLSASENLYGHYGILPFELIGRNLGMIIPKFIRTPHQKFLENHLYHGSTSRLNKNIFLYGENSEGYVVPQRIYISPHPDDQYEFSYLGILRPIRDVTDKVIMLENGKIGGITKGLAEMLKIYPENIQSLDFYSICPKMETYNKILNYHYFIEDNRIKTPVWLYTATTMLDLEEGEEKKDILPFPFSKAPERAKNMLIPNSEEEFYMFEKIIREIMYKGFDVEVSQHFGKALYRFNITLSVEILHDGTIIKYLSLFKVDENKVKRSDSYESANILEYASHLSESGESGFVPKDSINYTAFTNEQHYFRNHNAKKTTMHINKSGPKKKYKPSQFLSPAHGEADSRIHKKKKNDFAEENFSNAANLDFQSKQESHGKNNFLLQHLERRKKRNTLIIGLETKIKTIESIRFRSLVLDKKLSYIGNYSKFLEQSIEQREGYFAKFIINFSKRFIVGLMLFLMIEAYIENSSIFRDIRSVLILRNSSISRYFDLLMMNYNYEQVFLRASGLLENSNSLLYYKNELRSGMKSIQQENNFMKNFLHHFEDDFALKFFSNFIREIPEDEVALTNLSKNTFESINGILSGTNKLLLKTAISPKESELIYVLKNLNFLFFKNIDLENNLINDHLDTIYRAEFSCFLRNIIIALVFSLVNMTIYIKHEIEFHQKKDAFFGSLSTIKSEDINYQICSIKIFASLFEDKQNFDYKVKDKFNCVKLKNSSKESSKYARSLDYHLIHRKFFQRMIFFFLAVIFNPLLIYFFMSDALNFKDNLSGEISSIKTLEQFFSSHVTLMTQITKYISSDSTGQFIGVPLDSYIKNQIEFLQSSQEKFVNSLNTLTQDLVPKNLIFNDLCNFFAENISLCHDYDRLSASRGLVYLNSYFLLSYKLAKANFDTSNHSIDAMKISLSAPELENSRQNFQQIYKFQFFNSLVSCYNFSSRKEGSNI